MWKHGLVKEQGTGESITDYLLVNINREGTVLLSGMGVSTNPESPVLKKGLYRIRGQSWDSRISSRDLSSSGGNNEKLKPGLMRREMCTRR